jgi:hypothetical protein
MFGTSIGFLVCAHSNCGYDIGSVSPSNNHGIELLASGSLGPEIENALITVNASTIPITNVVLIRLGDHVKARYDANKNAFDVFLRSDHLVFHPTTDRIRNASELTGKPVYITTLPMILEDTCVLTDFILTRSDGKVLMLKDVRAIQYVTRDGLRHSSRCYYGSLNNQ